MIRLYDRKATDFSTNGIKVLQPISCIVTEQINLEYSLLITMPKGDTSIQNESIISAPTPKNGNQLFRVFDTSIDAFGNNEYRAQHIFYDLREHFLEDVRPSGSAQAALGALLSGTGFSGETDLTTSSTSYYEMMGTVEALLGGDSNDEDNAFINRWGGEIERDNFTVRAKRHIGEDRNVTIRYRKNLTGLTVETDMTTVVTRIYPTGRGADGQTLLKLPEKFVDSPYLNSYVHPRTRRVDYSDIQVGDNMTQDAAYDALRTAAQGDFANGIDKPTLNAVVEFVPLETTEEYKNLAVLEKVYLGDTIHVYHEPLGIQLDTEVMKYEYDCLAQRYISIELGTPAAMIGSNGSAINQAIEDAKEEAKTTAKDYSAGVKQLNNLMANALGFYQTEQPQPDGSTIFYLHNKPALADSNIIWKISVDGFAWTTDGTTWQNGITADGNLVIKTISVIGLVADWIVAGILKSKNGRVYFDLDNNVAAVSKLVSATDEATDVYAEIGKVLWSDGSTSKGMGVFSSDGMIAYLDQTIKDAVDNIGLEVAANGMLMLRSNTAVNSDDNTLKMYTDIHTQGHIEIWRANNNNGDEAVFNAYNGETDINGRNNVVISVSAGNVVLRMNSGGWYFSAGGQDRGYIDSNGWNGWVNGAQALHSGNIKDADGNIWHFNGGIMTGVN